MTDENNKQPNQPRPPGQPGSQTASPAQPGQGGGDKASQTSRQPEKEVHAASPETRPAGAAGMEKTTSASQDEGRQDSPSGQDNIGEIEKLRAENAELRDKYIRLMAEMENLRKRTEREKKEIAKYAISDFARDVLSLGDNFQLAINAVPREAAERDEALRSFLEGVEMNERELQKMLARYGVTRIDPKGEKFDPNFHQAVQQAERPDLPNDTVCDVFQVGYMIADRVLRPAVVSVAKGGPKLPADVSGLASQKGPSVPLDAAHDDAPGDDATEDDRGQDPAGQGEVQGDQGKTARQEENDAGGDDAGNTTTGINIDRKA